MWKCEKCGKEFEKGKSYAVHRTHCLTGREPWNKGKKGLQVAWNKGLPKEESHLYNKSSNAKNYKWTEEQKANLKVLH
jgi:ribosomal protein L24E